MVFKSSRARRKERYLTGKHAPSQVQLGALGKSTPSAYPHNESDNVDPYGRSQISDSGKQTKVSPAQTKQMASGASPGNAQDNNPRRMGIEAYSRSAYGSGTSKSARHPVSGKGRFDKSVSTMVDGAGAYDASNYKAKRKLGRTFKIVLGCFVATLLLGIGVAAAYLYNLNHLLNNRSAEEEQALNMVLDQRRTITEPFYIMLIGSDERDGKANLGQRSDTNILTRVDPRTNTITMISIPRDTKIEIKGQGVQKFNAAYAFGGTSSTIREASNLTGVGISYYAEISFTQLVRLVDAIGGVEVDVPKAIKDNNAGNVSIPAGRQTLNGEAALVFARSRKYADGDFTRQSNQRVLIEAIVNKMLSLPITALPAAIQDTASMVKTNLSVVDIVSLATKFKTDGYTVYSAMLPARPISVGGISYVDVDKNGLQQMMQLVEAGQDPKNLVLGNASFSIESALRSDSNAAHQSGAEPNKKNFVKEH